MKTELIEQYAEVYNADGYPPIAGKILGLFYISDEAHFTFEEIMERVEASKSATSKALKLLLESGEVGFKYAVDNKRKRLFYLNIKGTIANLEKILKAYQTETILLKQSLKLRSEANPQMNMFINDMITFNDDVLGFIEEKIAIHLKKNIEKFNQ